MHIENVKRICYDFLEDYNDVFADIVNVLLFQGKNVVDPLASIDGERKEFIIISSGDACALFWYGKMELSEELEGDSSDSG